MIVEPALESEEVSASAEDAVELVDAEDEVSSVLNPV